jgi:hypothetical protein
MQKKKETYRTKTMKAIIVVLFAVALCAELSLAGNTGKSGGNNGSGCTIRNGGQKISERINQGVKDVLNADGVSGRVDALKSTLKDAENCGEDALSDGVNRVTGDSEGDDNSGE